MADPTRQFRLLLDDPTDLGASATAWPLASQHPPPPEALQVEDGLSYLVVERGARPCLNDRAPSAEAGAYALEPLHDAAHPALVFACLNGHAPLLNGAPAPPVAVLREGDVLSFERTSVELHVTLYHQVSIGSVPGEFVGKRCPVCRSRFEAGQRVYLCPCGTPMHSEGEEVADESKRLCCAELAAECRNCHRPVVLEAGYSFLPDVS